MAKQSGLGDYIAVDDSSGSARDISEDVNSLSITNGQATTVVTGIDKSAVERLPLLADSTITINATFDSASNKEHDVFKSMANARTVTYCVGGNTSSNPKLEMEMLISSVAQERTAEGALNVVATLELQSGTVPAWTTV